ncbi:MAG: sensor histidine kinase [Halieaceae bacterium]|jgi:two-component system sensor histidine kinase AlgZ|nr:sensor histidine kinase [Halieaceae bacterium]
MNGDNGNPAQAPGEFFIPDLCATRPVLLMFILSELLVVVYVLGGSRLPVFDWEALALASLFVQWIMLLCAGLLCASRPLLARLSLPVGVMLSFLIILLVAALSSMVAAFALANTAFGPLDSWWLLRNLLVAAVFGGIALRYFYLQQQLRAREQAELTARIESLRSRIRPHFLFNTMNSIASLISTRPEQAEQAVEDLSELFRASLVENDDGVTLADELHLCRLYLGIEQLRLGDRMQVDWQVDKAAETCALPSLLLQPLVENAVYHGVARMPEGGTIGIQARRDDQQVQVEISNPVPAAPAVGGNGHQIALDNIRQRLEAIYGGAASLEAYPSETQHRVVLSVPFSSEVAV